MNRLEEYGAKRVELAAEMRKLTELDAMTEVQSKEFDRLQGEVRAVDKQIAAEIDRQARLANESLTAG